NRFCPVGGSNTYCVCVRKIRRPEPNVACKSKGDVPFLRLRAIALALRVLLQTRPVGAVYDRPWALTERRYSVRKEDLMNRRTFFKQSTAALGASPAASREMAQPPQSTDTTRFFPPGFKAMKVQTSGATINLVTGGEGPPLLLIHGAPFTH